MRIIGPNCLGVIMPRLGLNATFADVMARRQRRLHQPERRPVHRRAAIRVATQRRLQRVSSPSARWSTSVWGDLIDYLGDDPHTQSIVLYMESIGNARSFLSAAREMALTKPIIVIKAGRTEATANSHSAYRLPHRQQRRLAGRFPPLRRPARGPHLRPVLHGRRAGQTAAAQGTAPHHRDQRHLGPGVLATDALITGGGEMTEISPETMEALNELFPPPGVVITQSTCWAMPMSQHYAKALEIAAGNPTVMACWSF